MTMHEQEQATARTSQNSSLSRYIAGSKRLLDEGLCDVCKTSATVAADGRGRGYCARCSTAALTERRVSFERSAKADAEITAARAWKEPRR